MFFAYSSPPWFFGYDAILEFVFAVVSLVIALFAFKIYKVSDQKQVKLFGIAFLFVSLSYFTQSLFNYLIISRTNATICRALNWWSVALFDTLGLYVHMGLMIIGLIILVYMSFKTEKQRILWLLLATSLLILLLSANRVYIFFLLSSVYLLFITWHFVENYLSNRKTRTLLVAVAFLFLLFGNIHFIFSVDHQLFYVIGHFLELCAYLLILWNFFLVLRK